MIKQCQILGKLFTGLKYKLLWVFAVILDIYWPFIPHKITLTKTMLLSMLSGFQSSPWASLVVDQSYECLWNNPGGYNHDDVINWKHFPRYWPFVRGIHLSPVNSPHKGQWHGALMFSLICALNKRLSKQPRGWWFETPSRWLWRHCNDQLKYETTIKQELVDRVHSYWEALYI